MPSCVFFLKDAFLQRKYFKTLWKRTATFAYPLEAYIYFSQSYANSTLFFPSLCLVVGCQQYNLYFKDQVLKSSRTYIYLFVPYFQNELYSAVYRLSSWKLIHGGDPDENKLEPFLFICFFFSLFVVLVFLASINNVDADVR